MKITDTITISELNEMASKMYGTFVKAVVDLQKNELAVDAEMHADIEEFLLQKGSKQNDLWGINLYPGKYGTTEFVEFDSMINIRPRQQNMSRNVEDVNLQRRIIELVNQKVKK